MTILTTPVHRLAPRIRAANDPQRPHRVVVVGGGFGGLQAVRRLRRPPVGVTLIDRRNFHLFHSAACRRTLPVVVLARATRDVRPPATMGSGG